MVLPNTQNLSPNTLAAKRPKVLISAYACEPNKGSEPGVGWNWAKQIAKFAEAWVITRANNREVIEEELKKNPEPNMHFVYVDLPKWMQFWKKGQKGVHLYYYLWQSAAYFKAKTLTKDIKFDIAHHITFVNDWIPPLISLLPLKFIWGSVGSNKPIPKGYLINLKYYLKDRLKHYSRVILRQINPFMIVTLIRSSRIMLITKDQLTLFPFDLVARNKIMILQANAVDVPGMCVTNKKRRSVLIIYSAGALTPIKGFHLALSAFAKLYDKKKDIRLMISGNGDSKRYLQSLADGLKIKDKIVFTGNIPREKVIQLMAESDIFLFPSFEGGGMVVLEAMAAGLPVVCLDYGGPGEMVTPECGIKVKPITYEQTINDLAEALLKLANDPDLRIRMGEAGRKRVMEFFTWEKKGEQIQKIYEEVLGYKL